MPLLKRRPEIQVFSPRAITPATPFAARVVLACADAVPVSAVDVELRGAHVSYVHTQYGTSRHEEVFLRQRARVAERGELAAGEHTFAARFALPPGAPATYLGEELRIEYSLHVHVDIPWWPDARAAFVVRAVASPAAGGVAGDARVFASHAGGAPGAGAYLEVSLGGADIEAGEVLRGAVALANTAANHYRAVDLALVAVESVQRPLGRYTHHRRARAWTLALGELVDNEPLRFTIRLPEDLVPGFDLGACALQWFLEVRARVAWSRDPRVWVPLRVLGPRTAEGGERRAPLAVGSERLELLWRGVADLRGLTYSDGVLRRRVGEVEVKIAREHRGRSGSVLVGELAFPDVGIGLAAGRGRAPLSSRDTTQATWLLEQLGEALRRRPPTDVSDARLVFELDDGGQDRASLVAFVDEVVGLAGALDPALAGLPPPAAMAAMVPAWERAALHLGGRLRAGAMAIQREAEGATLELRTAWDPRGEPLQTVLELRPARPIDGRHHLTWAAEMAEEPASALPLGPLLRGARALDIGRASVRIFLAGALADPLSELDRITALIDLGRRLDGHIGVYR